MSMDFIHRTMKPLYIATEQSKFFVLRLWKNAQSGEEDDSGTEEVPHAILSVIRSPPPAAGRSFCHPVNAS